MSILNEIRTMIVYLKGNINNERIRYDERMRLGNEELKRLEALEQIAMKEEPEMKS